MKAILVIVLLTVGCASVDKDKADKEFMSQFSQEQIDEAAADLEPSPCKPMVCPPPNEKVIDYDKKTCTCQAP